MSFLSLALLVPLLHCAVAEILDLGEGRPCSNQFDQMGICTLLTKCRDPGDFRREHPPICSFRGREPIICCPRSTSDRIKPGTKANQFCGIMETNYVRMRRRHIEESKNEISIQVLGGDEATPMSHVHMALIGYGSASEKEWGCGGSLVTAKYVLSAAHCAKPELLGPAKWARLGELDISTTQDDAKVQDRSIVKRILHPGYKEPQVYNDIALFELDQEVQFTPWVSPVCLHTERGITSDVATVTGWGRVDFAGATSNKLLEADLNIFNDTECRRLLPYTDNKTPKGIDPNLMLCAGKRDGSKDACSGDSGGPLVISVPGQCLKVQIGITSYGSQCGLPDSPGVYTRVSQYVSWIEGIVFNEETDVF